MHDNFKHLLTVAAILALILLGGDAISQTTTTLGTDNIPSYHISEKLPPNIKELVKQGRFDHVIKELQAIASKGENWAREEIEQLEWLKRDYSLTSDGMLRKIRDFIPDASQADLNEWTEKREIQWYRIDGERRYFRREPVNLFRFSESAKTRRDAHTKNKTSVGDPAAGGGKISPLDAHIEKVVELTHSSDQLLLKPSEFLIRHTITVKPGAVAEREIIRCWMPLPREYRQQSGVKDLITTPSTHRLSHRNAAHNTLYFEQLSRGEQPTIFVAEYEYTNHAWAPRITTETINTIRETPVEDVSQYLREEAPHIVLSPAIRKLAAQIVGDERNPYRKAELIFRWMDKNIRYCAEMEYATITAISEKALQERRGDCGVHAILFITLCRASGVPARWQSGWVTQPDHWNMHDWAEFYVEPFGWLPADPSVGLRKSQDPEVRDFLIGHIDAYRMISNLGICAAFDPPKEHHRSDPVDSQRGEVETEKGNLYFDQWDYNVEIVRHREP